MNYQVGWSYVLKAQYLGAELPVDFEAMLDLLHVTASPAITGFAMQHGR